MFHAADQMAAMKISSVVLPFASVSIEMEKKFQGVENRRTVLQTVLNSVCLLFHNTRKIFGFQSQTHIYYRIRNVIHFRSGRSPEQLLFRDRQFLDSKQTRRW